jgi:hypothetical protein
LSGGRAEQGDKGTGSPRRWRDGGVAERIQRVGGESPDGGRHCPEALPRLCKSEEEVRAELKWEKWGGGSAVAALTSERG